MAVFANLLEVMGATPTVRLHSVVPVGAARVLAKLEMFNPGGSVKDRIGVAMIECAEAEGRLTTGSVIVEPTTGNTGIAIALVCAVKGYRCILVMQESMSLERREVLKSYGAEIVLTRAEDGMEGAVRKAEAIAAATPRAFMPQQFKNRANPEIHRRTTARETMAALDGGVPDAFVAGVGTGGTLTGVGQVLKAASSAVRVVAVEPATSAVLSGGVSGPHKLQGIGAGFVPEVLDRSVIDEVIRVGDREAYEMKARLARDEGLLVGISSGAAAVAAVEVASRLGAEATVVTVFPDSGHRYFSLDEYFVSP